MNKQFNKCVYILALAFLPLVHSFAMEAEKKPLPKASIAVDAISGIIDAFNTHSVVALGEGAHRNEQGHAFRLSLIRDPRFAELDADIVVEFGNALYQDIIDLFVLGQDVPYQDVPYDDLRKIWQNTTQSNGLWDVPIYEEFFRAVRDVNINLPENKKLRVLLGDPPIDWDTVRNAEDFFKCFDRDESAQKVILKEVLNKNRKALLIYGEGHLGRNDLYYNSPVNYDHSIVTRLESQDIKVFSIYTHTDTSGISGGDIAILQPEVKSWPIPSLINLRGTTLGATDFAFYSLMEFTGKEGFVVKTRPGLRIEEEFDALLYLGPTSAITYSKIPTSLIFNYDYIKMRRERAAIFGRANNWTIDLIASWAHWRWDDFVSMLFGSSNTK